MRSATNVDIAAEQPVPKIRSQEALHNLLYDASVGFVADETWVALHGSILQDSPSKLHALLSINVGEQMDPFAIVFPTDSTGYPRLPKVVQ